MPVQLLSLSDGPSVLLDKPILLFGRHPECDIQLNSRKVSRRHCCIAQVHDYLVVRDLGSTNGVRVNGNRVFEGQLHAGDELTIGNFKYQICWDKPGDMPPVPIAAVPKIPAVALGAVFSRSVDQLLAQADQPIPLSEDVRVSPILCARPVPSRPVGTAISEPILPENLSVIPSSGATRRAE